LVLVSTFYHEGQPNCEVSFMKLLQSGHRKRPKICAEITGGWELSSVIISFRSNGMWSEDHEGGKIHHPLHRIHPDRLPIMPLPGRCLATIHLNNTLPEH
jgi:hypothetical protein